MRYDSGTPVRNGHSGTDRTTTTKAASVRIQLGTNNSKSRARESRKEEGRRRRGRPRLTWDDCVNRDVSKAGEEEDWKKKTNGERRVEKTIR